MSSPFPPKIISVPTVVVPMLIVSVLLVPTMTLMLIELVNVPSLTVMVTSENWTLLCVTALDRYRAVGPAAAERDVAEGHHRGVRRGRAQGQAARCRLHVPDEEVKRAGRRAAAALAVTDHDSRRAVVVVSDGTRGRVRCTNGVARACGHRQDHRLVGLQIRVAERVNRYGCRRAAGEEVHCAGSGV